VLPVPLLANFSYSNDQVSAALSKELVEIVQYDTDSSISLVNVEADEPGVQELLQRYRISQIPTVIALRGGNPVSRYTVPGNTVDGINREQLKAWIEDAATRRQ
jgi:thioredoxin-like negative regulator of GroEL